MYSFHPNQEGELDFSEGDLIILTKQVDVNWYEGTLGDQSGLFPVCYVDVLVPLPLPWQHKSDPCVVYAGLNSPTVLLYCTFLKRVSSCVCVTGNHGHRLWWQDARPRLSVRAFPFTTSWSTKPFTFWWGNVRCKCPITRHRTDVQWG